MLSYLIVALLVGAVGWYFVERGRRVRHVVSSGLHEEITLPHDAEFELYTNAFSHCSRKARLVFAELGLPYAHKPIDLIETGHYETISPAYLKVNPAGQVPTLVHKGHPVYESDDIMKYAVAVAGPDAPALTPSDPAQQAQMEKWIDYAAIVGEDPIADMEGSAGACVPILTTPLFATMIRYIPVHRILVGLLFHHDKRRPVMFLAFKLLGVKRLPKIAPVYGLLTQARHHMGKHLLALEAQLEQSGGPWILGDNYTLADISWAASLLRVAETGFLDHYIATQNLPHVAAYYAALQARPAWGQAIEGVPHDLLTKGVADLKEALSTDPTFAKAMHGA